MNTLMHKRIFDLGDLIEVEYEGKKYKGEIVDVGYNDEQWRVLRIDGHVEIVNEVFMTLLVPDSNA